MPKFLFALFAFLSLILPMEASTGQEPDRLRMNASYYGPGLYNRDYLACRDNGRKIKLQPDDARVVAHKTLPCGTRLQVTYGKRTVLLTVLDRGPHIQGRDLDINKKAAQSLGLVSKGHGWVDVTVLG